MSALVNNLKDNGDGRRQLGVGGRQLQVPVETLQQDLVQLPQEVFVIRTDKVTKDFPSLHMRRDLRIGEKCQIWTNCQSFIGKTKSG